MKRIFKLFLGASISLLFASCTVLHNGSMDGSALLNAANYTYIQKNAVGEAEVSYVFGLGGSGQKTLVGTAKQKLMKQQELEDNQAMVNITVNYKTTYRLFGVLITKKCIVTADIVEFK